MQQKADVGYGNEVARDVEKYACFVCVTPCVTGHMSHVTRSTSHVTHHMSHITCQDNADTADELTTMAEARLINDESNTPAAESKTTHINIKQ